jgi:REP element-mobilizing transposase RayT
MNVTSEFNAYRRNLPHWQVGGYSYFVTFRAVRLLSETARSLVVSRVLKDHNIQFTLFFGVVMHDHVHLLLRPLELSTGIWNSLPKILQGIKGSTAREINLIEQTSGTLWQKESFDRMIRNEKELFEKWQYMWNNPIKAGLSDGFDEYPFYIKP